MAKEMVSFDGSAEFLIGLGLGYIVDDFWERLQFPGYGKRAFDLPEISGKKPGVGWDDLAEVGIGLIALLWVNRWVGIGFIAGLVLRKVLEYRNP